MKFSPFLLCAVFTCTTASTTTANPIIVSDDAQATITLPRPAKRIATLAPFLTELVYAAGAQTSLVGVSAFSDYPSAAATLPVVADYQGVAMESLLALKPDLVLAWQTGNRPQDITRIQALGIPVMQFELKTLADIGRAMTQIALISGVSELSSAAKKFEIGVANLKANYSNPAVRKVRYFLPIERMPLMTLSGEHIVSNALALCGGENIFAAAKVLAPVVDKEGVVARNPEIIFVSARNLKEIGSTAVLAPVGGGLEGLPVAAIKNNRVYGLNPDWLMRPTPRMLGAVESACAAIQLVRTGAVTK